MHSTRWTPLVSAVLRLLLLSRLLAYGTAEADAENAAEDSTKAANPEEDGANEIGTFSDDDLKQAHTDMDENKNAKISHEEVMDFVEKHRKEVLLEDFDPEDELKRKDTSGDGVISLEEHLKDAIGSYEKDAGVNVNEDQLKKAKQWETERFQAADSNGDGVLQKDELAALVAPETTEKMLEVNLRHTMEGADTNSDGKLTLEEFRAGDFLDDEAATSQTVSDEEVEERLKSKGEGNSNDPQDAQEAREELVAQKLFTRLDTNSDGTIDQEELRSWANGKIEREDISNKFIEALDKDGDKQIDTDELIQGKDTLRDSQIQDYLIAWAKGRQIIPRGK